MAPRLNLGLGRFEAYRNGMFLNCAYNSAHAKTCFIMHTCCTTKRGDPVVEVRMRIKSSQRFDEDVGSLVRGTPPYLSNEHGLVRKAVL